MKIQLFKKDNRLYLQMPEDVQLNGDIELFELKEGYYLIATLPSLNEPAKPPVPQIATNELTNHEQDLLKKLLSVRFEKRTPMHFDSALGEEEKRALSGLLARKALTIFKSQKYPEGVYNINDQYYALARKNMPLEKLPHQAFVEPQSGATGITLDALNAKGYAIILDNQQAYAVSEELRKQNRKSSVTGIKGFDGKFYLVSAPYFQTMSQKILDALIEPMTLEKLTTALGAELQGIKAVSSILAERGDIIEKRKDVYCRV